VVSIAELSEFSLPTLHRVPPRALQHVKLRSAQPSSIQPTGSSFASLLENCPPYFYHITSFLSHLPFPGLVATLTASSRPSFPSCHDFQQCLPLFYPFLSCPCSFFVVRSLFVPYHHFPFRFIITPFLIPPPSSSFISWYGLTAETRSRAPPFYLRIVCQAIPYSSFVASFLLSHCPLAFPSRHSHIS